MLGRYEMKRSCSLWKHYTDEGNEIIFSDAIENDGVIIISKWAMAQEVRGQAIRKIVFREEFRISHKLERAKLK